ncbi:hypothetical protein Tco_0636026 [Tanacetum coccineum]
MVRQMLLTVAYKLELPEELSNVHNTFHVSNLKKCLSDESLVIPMKELKLDDKLNFMEEPVKIMDREIKALTTKSYSYNQRLPTAIRNVIGTTHVMEIKTQSYYEYGTHESFTCWRSDPVDAVDDRASSSSRLISDDDLEPSFKRPTKKPSVSTPSKPNEDVSRKRTDLEDSDVDETPKTPNLELLIRVDVPVLSQKDGQK